ncbi:MAG: outer membrane protein assembly factor [Balneolaceae bacterium]|nr:MAG: outer membrane protein assembly factor [Balneolaceae bacterium]
MASYGQSAEDAESDEYEVVRKVRFSGNSEISNRVLTTLVRSRTNRTFLGIPRFTPWYFIWRAVGVGESPSILDRDIIASDIDRIILYYENLGFFEVSVDTSVIEYRNNRFEISFIIEEGPRSTIETVSYTGLPVFDEDFPKEPFFRQSLFRGSMVNDSTFSAGRPYRLQELREEQTRIINYLKDYGYAAVQRDSVRALLKQSENPNEYDVLFQIRHGELYHFGDVYVSLFGPGELSETFDDSLRVKYSEHHENSYSLFIEKQAEAQTDFALLQEQLHFQPGSLFSQSAYLRSVNSFQTLGNMVFNRFGLSETGSIPDFSQSEIPVYFSLQTLPKHSLRAEVFGMRRYGFGTGIGANYNNNNVFRNAENFTLGINTNLEYVPSRNLSEISPRDDLGRRTSSGAAIFQSYEIRAEYSLPRIMAPFRFLTESDRVEGGRTRYSLSYNQSNQLYFDINTDIRFNLRYELRHTDRLFSFIDLLELDVIDTNPSSQFRENLINEFGEGSFEFLRIEQDFKPQFSSSVRYTFRSSNTNIIKRDNGHFSEVSLAFAGNLPYLLDRFVVTPGTLEGTLPPPFGVSSNSLAYSRFLKLSADYRRYVPVSANTVFAFRVFGGIAQPVGSSEIIPLNRRFFAGGSNDIRGWNPFRLGPGSISPEEVSIPGGEIKLAVFKEFRQIFLRNVFNANWQIAWHTDAGNVWYGPRNVFRDEDNIDLLRDGKFFLDSFYEQIAVGSGIGLRFDWDFLVVRFDLTYRIHDLEMGWFRNRLSYFSFGIGHSF